MIGIMAAAISTVDSILLTLSSVVARDVYRRSDEAQQLLIGKIVIPIIAVLAFSFAQLELNLIAVLSVSASAGLLVMVPAIVGAFFWKRGTAAGVIASTTVGGLLVIVLELFQLKWLGQGSGVWGLTVSLVFYVGVSLLTRAPEEKATAFLSYVRKALREKGAV